ncbi:MAG: hypothetical protein H6605_10885 [Flavobacteriales bacterium]|nr:hypothetical protein [Flavobacteriales bacterium]
MSPRQQFIFRQFQNLFTLYKGEIPFYHYLNSYFRKHKNLGSKDRKIIRELCYRTFRFGPVWKEHTIEEVFLWNIPDEKEKNDLLKQFFKGLARVEQIPGFKYPFIDLLSEKFNNPEYFHSLKHQPKLWIRISGESADLASFRKEMKDLILSEEERGRFICFGIKNGTEVESFSKDIVVQDISSLQATELIQVKKGDKVWDICSGAGGKSLFLAQTHPKAFFYASDKRKSILDNQEDRFNKIGLIKGKQAIVDLEFPVERLKFGDEVIDSEEFDVIIADVPCTGSGTWAREPENISFFDPGELEKYVTRQSKIMQNSLPFLKTGGDLYYITCSVFRSENEEMIRYLSNSKGLELEWMKYIEGYELGADTLFIARLRKTI